MRDLNADISDRKSVFGRYLVEFCHDNKLLLSSKIHLPTDSYTYVSEAWNTTSWLDYCVSTADAHECVDKVEILYGFATTDHMPVSIMLNVENLPAMTTDDNQVNHGGKIECAKLSENDLLHYHDLTEKTIGNIEIPYDAIMCDNFNCDTLSSEYHFGFLFGSPG
ncbi:hypothetical protein ABVT39_012473 [Epinephelus coioides]